MLTGRKVCHGCCWRRGRLHRRVRGSVLMNWFLGTRWEAHWLLWRVAGRRQNLLKISYITLMVSDTVFMWLLNWQKKNWPQPKRKWSAFMTSELRVAIFLQATRLWHCCPWWSHRFRQSSWVRTITVNNLFLHFFIFEIILLRFTRFNIPFTLKETILSFWLAMSFFKQT